MLNSLRNTEITMTLPLQSFLAVATKQRSEMTSYLNNGYDVMNYFAKFEKFLPHSIIMPSFMAVGSQIPELDWGIFCPPPPYNLSSQNTPYKIWLKCGNCAQHIRNFPSQDQSGMIYNDLRESL